VDVKFLTGVATGGLLATVFYAAFSSTRDHTSPCCDRDAVILFCFSIVGMYQNCTITKLHVLNKLFGFSALPFHECAQDIGRRVANGIQDPHTVSPKITALKAQDMHLSSLHLH